MSAEPKVTFARIADWVDGRLSEQESDQVAAAVAADPELQADLEWMQELVRTGRALPLVAEPPLLRQRLRQLYRRWARDQVAPAPSLFESFIMPIFDSRRDRLAVGVRGPYPDGDTIHLVWRTDLAELIVEARPSGADRFRLTGQVLLGHATSSPIFEAIATGPDCTVRTVDGDHEGRFALDVPSNATRLRVSNGDLTILGSIDLTADPTGSPNPGR